MDDMIAAGMADTSTDGDVAMTQDTSNTTVAHASTTVNSVAASTADDGEHVEMSAGEVVFKFVMDNTVFDMLPEEIKEQVKDHLLPHFAAAPTQAGSTRSVNEPNGPRGDPSVPPVSGACPIKDMPVELHRQVLSYCLPAKNAVIKPKCVCNESSEASTQDKEPISKTKPKPKRNKTSDLMVLCKKFKNVVATYVYQEQPFEIHVHEGIHGGGIEFINEGRQLLQYLSEDYGIDSRFPRFNDDAEFGFDQLKKINLIIFAKPDSRNERHTAMNTYFMNLALAQMLRHGCRKDRDSITSLNITFDSSLTHSSQHLTGRHAIMRAENQWWDTLKNQPLSSEIHDMSDVELMLRPFSILRKVQNINITLPPRFQSDISTAIFVAKLEQIMTGPEHDNSLVEDDSFEAKANAIKVDLYQNFVFGEKYGKGGKGVDDLTDQDMLENEQFDQEEQQDDDNDSRPGYAVSAWGKWVASNVSDKDAVSQGDTMGRLHKRRACGGTETPPRRSSPQAQDPNGLRNVFESTASRVKRRMGRFLTSEDTSDFFFGSE